MHGKGKEKEAKLGPEVTGSGKWAVENPIIGRRRGNKRYYT